MISAQYLSAINDEIRALQEGGHGKALLAISAGSFLMIGVQMIYPVLLPDLRADYGLDLTTAGFLLTVLWIANATGQLPGGMLADRIGEGRTLVVSVGISAITLGMIITVDSIVALFGATMLLGVGLGLYGVARYTALYDMFPERTGSTVGIVLAAADAGQAVLPPAATLVAAIFVWQYGFGITLPLFLLVLAGLWLYVPAQTSRPPSDPLSFTDVRAIISLMRTRAVIYGASVLIVYFAIWVAFTSFYPTYLIEVKGLSTTVVAIYFGSFFAVGTIVKPLSGAAYDRLGIRVTLFVVACISGVALILLPMLEGPGPLAAVTLMIAPILGSGTLAQSHLLESLSDEIKGTGLGVIRTGCMSVAAVTPTFFGSMADRGFFDEAFLVLAALAGFMILLVLRIPQK